MSAPFEPADWDLDVPSRHVNPDGSVTIVAALTDATTGLSGTITLTVETDRTTRAMLDGDAGLVPLGMWSKQ